MAQLKDIAEAAGVSIRTVSRVLKNDGYVAAEKRERIEQIAKQLGYRPNRMAQSLRTQQRCHVGLIARSAGELHAQKIMAFSQVLRNAGYLVDMFVDTAQDYPAVARRVLAELASWNPAGVAFLPGGPQGLASIVRELDAQHTPYIAMDTYEPAVDSVVVDRVQGVYEAVRRLAERGRRRIAFLGPRTDEKRLTGYKRAIKELAYEPSVIAIEPAAYREREDSEKGLSCEMIEDVETIAHFAHARWLQVTHFLAGRDAAKTFVEMDPRPDGIQAFSDAVAAGFLAGLFDLGVSVPGDVAVVGFDNRLAASVCWPSLTTVAQPNWEVGVAAAEILLKKIAGEPAPKGGWSTLLPCRLVERESA